MGEGTGLYCANVLWLSIYNTGVRVHFSSRIDSQTWAMNMAVLVMMGLELTMWGEVPSSKENTTSNPPRTHDSLSAFFTNFLDPSRSFIHST